tara:strand:- start:1066 stop:1500 length:435 start_codon:yes stop_codon:yes gene_type:complete
MKDKIFVATMKKVFNELDDKQIEIIFSTVYENIYDEIKDLILAVALNELQVDKLHSSEVIWCKYDFYYHDTCLPGVNLSHCIDHGFAKKINGFTYMKFIISNNPIYKCVQGNFLGCDLNGNPILSPKDSTAKRIDIINLENLTK